MESRLSKRLNTWTMVRSVARTRTVSPLTLSPSAGVLKTVTARKEVILSAGTVGTPHILLNSGIGDKNELSAVGVKALVNLPDVGKNLTDHSMVLSSWFVNSTDTLDNILRNGTLAESYAERWSEGKNGPFVESILGNQIIFARLPKDSPLLRNHADPTAGANSPHIEIIPVVSPFLVTPASLLNFFFLQNALIGSELPETGNFLTTISVVLNPVSRKTAPWTMPIPVLNNHQAAPFG
jgi:choline dehydrogenase-like flavoprotein